MLSNLRTRLRLRADAPFRSRRNIIASESELSKESQQCCGVADSKPFVGMTRQSWVMAVPVLFRRNLLQSTEVFMYRQGDVLIIPVESIPAELEPVERENGHLILAYGEATGHAHAIETRGASLFRDPKLMTIFLTVSGDPVRLEHDEHSTIMIPPGQYHVIRQREYGPSEIKNVVD
jgi:hypothetical protein